MLTFKEYLKEYLTDEQRSRYTVGGKTDPQSVMSKKSYDHTNKFFGEGNEIVREELKNPIIEKSEVHKAVERHLNKEISPEEYKSGIIKDKYGRDVKLGKSIKDNDLRNQFASDNTRAGVKSTTGHYATIARGVEVAGQTNSTPNEQHPKGHSWGEQSCKNVDTGGNRRYLRPEIFHGTTLVRVHDHTGQEIYRATLHPHTNNEGHIAYAVDSEYGLKHPSFTEHAHDVAKRLSDEHKDGSLGYHIHPKVYNNSGVKTILNPNISDEDLEKGLKHESDDTKLDIADSLKIKPKHIDKLLNDKNEDIRIMSIKNLNASEENLNKALNDKHWAVRRMALAHKNITPKLIHKALDDDNEEVQSRAAKHPNVSEENLNKALVNKNHQIRLIAARNPNINEKHLNHILDNEENEDVIKKAIDHKNMNEDLYKKAMNHSNKNVANYAKERIPFWLQKKWRNEI